MFFVVNRTARDLTIGDLDISIGPKKAIDLEKIRSREKIDASEDLQTCIKNGYLQVRHNSRPSQPQPKKAPAPTTDEQIEKIRQAVADEVKSQIADAMKNSGGSGGSNSEILDKLNALLAGQGSAPAQTQGKSESVEDELDEDTLAEIHAKRMKNVGSDSTGNVTYEKKKSSDSAVDRAAELDNLLG